MDSNQMARAHVAAVIDIRRTGTKEVQRLTFHLSFKLIENVLEPLACFVSFG